MSEHLAIQDENQGKLSSIYNPQSVKSKLDTLTTSGANSKGGIYRPKSAAINLKK